MWASKPWGVITRGRASPALVSFTTSALSALITGLLIFNLEATALTALETKIVVPDAAKDRAIGMITTRGPTNVY